LPTDRHYVHSIIQRNVHVSHDRLCTGVSAQLADSHFERPVLFEPWQVIFAQTSLGFFSSLTRATSAPLYRGRKYLTASQNETQKGKCPCTPVGLPCTLNEPMGSDMFSCSYLVGKTKFLVNILLDLLQATCWFLAWLILSSMKMEMSLCSETSVDFQQATGRYITEHCKNFNSSSLPILI
jgi:hypothetical protein